MLSALTWGAVAASSLVVGAAVGIARPWPARLLGLVLAFGAGALISAVAFELAEDGAAEGGLGGVGVGLAAGALLYYALSRALDARLGGQAAGVGLALGAFLDGIPEQVVLGIGLADGGGAGVGLIVAVFVSNLPEAAGSASELLAQGRRRGGVLLLWLGVAALCALATPLGYALAEPLGPTARGAIDGFAAGALLVMLVDTMIPDARAKGGESAGLATVLGFALAAALSGLGP